MPGIAHLHVLLVRGARLRAALLPLAAVGLVLLVHPVESGLGLLQLLTQPDVLLKRASCHLHLLLGVSDLGLHPLDHAPILQKLPVVLLLQLLRILAVLLSPPAPVPIVQLFPAFGVCLRL